jgi:hypothetical protein
MQVGSIGRYRLVDEALPAMTTSGCVDASYNARMLELALRNLMDGFQGGTGGFQIK